MPTTALTRGRRWSSTGRVLRVLLGAMLLTTCSTDGALAPRVPVQAMVDLSGLLRAGGQIPIPIDQVRIEFRRLGDSSLAFTDTRSIAQVGQANGTLTMRVGFTLDRSPEDFYLKVDALGGGVLYYVAQAIVTVSTSGTRTPPLTPIYVGPGANADSVVLTLAQTRVAPGDSTTATAVVLQGGQVVAGAPVGIISSDTTQVASHPTGIDQAYLVAAASATAGVTITALLPNGVQTTAPLAVGNAAAASVSPNSVVSQSGIVNQLVGAAPSVIVRDASNAPLPGTGVTFAVAGGGGTVTAGTQVTDANGIATVGNWRLGQTAGVNSLTATVSGLTPVTFTATAGPTTVGSLARISGDAQTANAGSALANPLVVEVRDSFNNVIPNATVQWSVTDGTIAPASGPSNAQGRAQATWTLGLVQASPTATAAVGTVQTSFGATAIPQTPTVQLAFAGVPGIGVGLSATVNVTLNQPVASGTLAVALSSSNTGVFTISPPDTVYIPQGQTAGTKVLNGISAGTATLTGTAPGFNQGTLTIVVQNRNISVPPTLNVPYGQTASLPIQLPEPAPAGGVTFDVNTSDGTRVGVVTPTVTIPAGGKTGNAILSGVLPGPARVTVTNPAYVAGTSAVTTAAALNIVQTSANPNASFGSPITINFESNGSPQAAPSPGIQVTLTPDSAGCVSATSPVTIPTGLVNVTSVLSYGGTSPLPCTTMVRATAPNLQSDSLTVTVSPVPAIAVQLGSARVGQGLEDQASVTLGATNHGGTSITVTSSNPSALLVAPGAAGPGASSIVLNVLPGVGSTSFYYQGLEGATGSVIITATATGFASSADTATVVQAGVEAVGLSLGTTTLSANDAFYAQVGIPNLQGTALQRVQNVRGGAPGPLVATFTSGTPVVGVIVDSLNGPAGGSTGTARIPSGRYYTSTSGPASGGVEFRPLTTGTSTVSVAIPGLLSMTNSPTIAVTQPVITISTNYALIGQGLIESGNVTLSAGNHGGASVTLVSRDPAVLQLSQTASGPAAASITVALNNGQTSFGYYLHALEGVTGSVQVVASEPRFAADSITATVVVPGIQLSGLPTTTTTLSADNAFYAEVGVPNGQGTGLIRVQSLRPDAPTELSPTFTTRVATVGTIVDSLSGPAGGTSGVARIRRGLYYTSTSGPASGGVAFHPLGTGSTDVTVTLPGFTRMANGTRTITVTQPTINAFLNFAQVGSGLMEAGGVTLSAGQHGGATVTVTSRDPAVALVSQTSTGAGAASITVPLANGQTSFAYYVQAPEGVTGSTWIVASEPRFAADSVAVTAVKPGIELAGVPASTTTLSPDNNIYAQVGVLNGQGTGLARVQVVRPGVPALTATVSSGTAAVAVIVDSLNQPLGAASGTARIRSGNYFTSPSGPASGGVAIHPLLSGSTVISVSMPGFTTATVNGSRTLAISQPDITLGTSFSTVGRGLQESGNGQLGASNHGGVTVTLTSSDPTVLLLSKDAATPGTASIQVPVTNGSTSFSFYVQGVEGASGTPSITAVASGFVNGTTSQTVAQGAVELIGPTTPIQVTAPDNAFYAQVGISNAQGTGLTRVQSVRAGAPAALVATFTSSNPGAGTIVDQTGPPGAASRTAQIPSGFYYTPTTVAQGGVAFHPVAAGGTTVSVAIPGLLTLINGSRLVTVAP